MITALDHYNSTRSDLLICNRGLPDRSADRLWSQGHAKAQCVSSTRLQRACTTKLVHQVTADGAENFSCTLASDLRT